jgi:hypothetical protein
MRHPNEDFEIPEDYLDPGSNVRDEIDRAVGGIANKKTRDWCYGYDAIGDVTKAYNAKLH